MIPKRYVVIPSDVMYRLVSSGDSVVLFTVVEQCTFVVLKDYLFLNYIFFVLLLLS